MRSIQLTALAFACAAAFPSQAAEEFIATGRYGRVVNAPTEAVMNPLKVVIDTRIPQDLKTVHEAIDFLLFRSGYRLADDSVLTKEAKTLLSHQLPQVHRHIGPMTLDQALTAIGGEAFELVVDPIHRKVAYVVNGAYFEELNRV